MDICGDAVKATTKELETLLAIQALLVSNQKLERQAASLAKGGELEIARAALLQNSQALSAARSDHEEILRDIRRLETDLELVGKREATDRERLANTAVARDVAGLQHELETLKKRRSDLEDVELELLDRKEQSDQVMNELIATNEKLETDLQLTKERIQLELSDLKRQFESSKAEMHTLRSQVSEDLLALFDQKASRGIAIGKLQKNACTACNMSLTATALSDLHNVPAGEVASCPECQAILVR